MTAYVRKTRCAVVRNERTGQVVAVVFFPFRRELEEKRHGAKDAYTELRKSNPAQWARLQ